MVDIKPFLKRIFNQVKTGNKRVVASEVIYEGIEYKVFTLVVKKTAMLESFYNNLAEGYVSKHGDHPHIVLVKVEDGVFIHLFKIKEDKDDLIATGQTIQ